eukprot:scaffold15929_cov159-Ochromonas_danica.AAC.6
MSADPHRPGNSEFVRKALAPLMKEDSHFHIDYHAQSSPYRQPVRFVDKKLKVRRALDRFEAKAMSPNSQHPTSPDNSHPSPPNRYQTLRVRPVSGRQYKRWMRKTSVHPREEVPGEIMIDRWPECRKHIPGATTWTNPSHRIETLGPLVHELNEALEADQANHQKEGDVPEGKSNTFYLTEEEKRAIHEIRTKLLRTMALCYAEYGSGVEKAEEDHLIELVAQQLTESQANHFHSPTASPPSSSAAAAVHPPSSHHALLYISHEEEAPGLRHSPKAAILPLQRLSPFEYRQFKLQHQLVEEEEQEEARSASVPAERESHHVIEDNDQHDFEEKSPELKESTEPIPVLAAGEEGGYEEDFVPQEETVPRRLEEDFANAVAISLDLRAPSETNSAMGETLYSEEAYSQEGYEQPGASSGEEKDLSPKIQPENSLPSDKQQGENVELEALDESSRPEKDEAVDHGHDAEREIASAADDEVFLKPSALPMDTDGKQPTPSPPFHGSASTTEEDGLIEETIEVALESGMREAGEASVEKKHDATSRESEQEPATSSGNTNVGVVNKEERFEEVHEVERGGTRKMPAFLLAELKAPRALKVNAVALPTRKGAEQEDARKAKIAEHKRKMAVFSSFLSRMERLKIPQIALQLLTRQDLLGRGKFAAVFRGRLAVASLEEPQEEEIKDERVADANHKEMVAVKTVFSFLSRQKQPEVIPEKDLAVKMAQYNVTSVSAPPVGVVEEFERELIALHALRHEDNIVHCLGFCREPLGIVFELIEGHDLFVSLHDPVWQDEVDEALRWQLFTEVVQGVKAMHDRGYIHRDLKRLGKSGGKLQYHAKIADLGSSRRLAPGEKLHDAVGTSGYVAPEVVSEGGAGYDFPADIFSCGVILWELLQREEGRLSNPFTGLSPIDFTNQMKQGLRPPFHHLYHMRQEVQRLLLSCWAFDPAGRPSATLLNRLVRILSYSG